jgi:hypothetical protein
MGAVGMAGGGVGLLSVAASAMRISAMGASARAVVITAGSVVADHIGA